MIAASCFKCVVVLALTLPGTATNAPWGLVPWGVDAEQLKQARERLKAARATRDVLSAQNRHDPAEWLRWGESRAQREVTELTQPPLRFHMPLGSAPPKTKIWD